MGLRFILGRAGTGKTRSCLEEIWGQLAIDGVKGSPLILLVPEQASFQMEKALTAHRVLRGMIRAQVMSFRRLGWLVFQEAGGTNRQYLDELGKMMTLRSILMEQEKSLQIFGGMVREQGFIAKLAGTLKEFKSYNITPGKLQEQYETLVSKADRKEILALKLQDLILLYREFENFIQGHHTDPDDYLTLLAQRIKLAPSLREARIWVDSFAGFTPQELQVLGSLMNHCQQVNLSLCLDGQRLTEPLTEMDLFHPSRVTYEKLQSLAYGLGVPLEPPKLLDKPAIPYRFQNPVLGFLEKHYDQYHKRFSLVPEGMRLVRAASHRVEVEGVAREILRLAREKNYRYREMAVILRDQESYRELVNTIFNEYRLPFFMDAKRPVTHHPLIELLVSALETVNTFWNYEPLFRYLKTDLVPVQRWQVDLLENYVLRYGIRGKKWLTKEPWDFGKEQDHSGKNDMLYKIREQSVAALRTFHDQVQASERISVERITTHLYELLHGLKITSCLDAWCREAEDEGQLDLALEHKQVWDGVMELFDQLVAALGREEMTLAEYAKVLEAGLQSLRLGLIPPALDQVLVGSIERSRQPDLKAVFLLGLNEGVFPASIKEDEIFLDGEREVLASNNLELAPTSKTRLFHEQYLAYIAFTRASEYLWVSYPEGEEAGQELTPSLLVGRLKELVPKLEMEYLASEPGKGDFSPIEYLANSQKAIAYLGAKLREADQGKPLDSFWLEVYQWLADRSQLHPQLQRVFSALDYHNYSDSLGEGVGAEFYGSPLKGSVSRLEAFAACPFRYFVQYGLGLKERELYRVDAPLMGNFYHMALEALVTRIHQKGKSWDQLTDEELTQLTEEVTKDIIPEMEQGIFLSTARHQYQGKVMGQNLLMAVQALPEHARLKTFQPAAVELAFGLSEGLPPLEIPIGDGKGLMLRGRIDRVDVAIIGEQAFLRVIDYKSSSRNLDLSQCYHGLALQLPVYLDAALSYYRHFTNITPMGAGMFYFPLKSPIIRLDNPLEPEKAQKEVFKKLKMQGWLLDQPELASSMGAEKGLINVRLTTKGEFYKGSPIMDAKQLTLLREFARHKLQELALGIYQGETAIAPYKMAGRAPCTYCNYKPCCQFDSMIAGNKYRFLPKLSGEQVWILMGREAGGEG